MANIHIHLPSFNAGELSPLLGGRFQVEKVQAGCRKLRNFIPHVHGPAFRRPGMEYIDPNADKGYKSNLRGFNFSTTTAFVLEFHPNGLGVFSNGVRVPVDHPSIKKPDWPYTSEEVCRDLQIAQVNDTCYIAHPNFQPRKLVRHADADWRLEPITWKWPALGDENVRAVEIAGPTVTGLLNVPLQDWEEFTGPTPEAGIALEILKLPDAGDESAIDITKATKTVRLWYWDTLPKTHVWKEFHKQNWTTVAPAVKSKTGPKFETFWKVTYDAGTMPTNGIVARVSWGGGTPAVNGTRDFHLNQVLIEGGKPVPISREVKEVPAGDWQMAIHCPTADSWPKDATFNPIRVQQFVPKGTDGKGIWAEYVEIPLKPGEIIEVRGKTLEKPTTFRFIWNSTRRLLGSARIEQLVFPVSTDVSLQCSATNGDNRTLTASAPLFQAGHKNSFWQLIHRRDATSVSIVRNTGAFTEAYSTEIRVSGRWDVFTYGAWEATVYLERLVSGQWEQVRMWSSMEDRNITASGEEDEEAVMRLKVSAGNGSAAAGADKPRFVLETADGRVYGVVQITAVPPVPVPGAGQPAIDPATWKSLTATVKVITPLFSTDPTTIWSEGAWSGIEITGTAKPEEAGNGYPRTVTLHGQRLWFGGTRSEPLRIWGSVVNDYENFRQSTMDDAAVSFVPAAQQANSLQWMVSHGENLVMGTNGDEWTISGGTERGPITPTSVLMQRRSGYGSSFQSALLLGETIAFVQRGGRKMRTASPRQDGLVWQAADITVLAEHIAREGVVQTAAMFFPQTILWAVTQTGKLLGMTFEQEQNVFAWHVHETDGLVESVAVIFGNNSDQVWLQVKRGQGDDAKRSIERLDPEVFAMNFADHKRMIYLDAAKRFEVTNATDTFTGLAHLAGRVVSVLGDGAEMPDAQVQVDAAGTVQIAAPVKTAVIGLRFTSELQPMRIEIPLRDGTAQHRQWRTSRVGLFLHESLGGEVADGPDGKSEKLNFRRADTPTDSVPPLHSGEIETAIESRSRLGVDVVVKTNSPLPFNLGAITLKGDVYGE